MANIVFSSSLRKFLAVAGASSEVFCIDNQIKKDRNLSQDYVRTAFAKGLSERRVIFKHAVRNSLIPLATGIGGIISVFLAGSYLIEKTFGIDGLGLLGYSALIDRDYDIIMGTLVISVFMTLVGNLISDLTYALVDPRIRFK